MEMAPAWVMMRTRNKCTHDGRAWCAASGSACNGAAASQQPPCGGRGGTWTGHRTHTVGHTVGKHISELCGCSTRQPQMPQALGALTLAAQQMALGGGRRAFSGTAAACAAGACSKRGCWPGGRAHGWPSRLPCSRWCRRPELHLPLQRLRRLQGGMRPRLLHRPHIVEPGVGQCLAGGDAVARVIAQQAGQQVQAGGIQLRHRLRAGWRVGRGAGACALGGNACGCKQC